MPFNRRQRILLLLFAGSALVLILLAAGLASVPFNAGRAFGSRAQDGGLIFPQGALSNEFLLIFFVILLILAVLAIVVQQKGRRRSLLMLALIWIVGVMLCKFIDQLTYEVIAEPTPALPQATARPTEVVPTFVPVETGDELPLKTPDWLVTTVGAVLAFLLAGALGLLYMAFGRRLPRDTVQDALALEAEQASEAIQRGEAIRDVILRCYNEMERTLAEERNLPRGSAVTPHEFEVSLVRLGFPAQPVRTLVELFEAVRYGHVAASPEQTRLAVESLEAIAAYVRRLGEQ